MKPISADISHKKKKFQHPDRNVSRDYQIFGFELAKKLGDLQRTGLYIKLAKELPRGMLEEAYRFAIDYQGAKSKARLFMYKLNKLKGNDRT